MNIPALGMKHINRLTVCYALKNHFKGGRKKKTLYPVENKSQELFRRQELLVLSGHLLACSSPSPGSLKGVVGL